MEVYCNVANCKIFERYSLRRYVGARIGCLAITLFVLFVEEELPQPVNAKSTEMARDAAITFFNFIEFVLSVLFFMSLNLLFNFILFVLVYLLSAFFLFENP